MVLVLSPNSTRLAIHEWLSLALGATVIIHLLLHWSWIVNTFRRFFGRLSGETRFNLFLNLALFLDFTVAAFSGVMISREALPLLGFTLPGGGAWRGVHELTANLVLIIFAVHLAIHWKWIVASVTRFIWKPLFGRMATVKEVPSAVSQKS